ncbi:MAG: DNA-directed RNA polymerase subunit F [Desulforhopalus sp.]|jgi:DNA-directed RNA polymerase subunit F
MLRHEISKHRNVLTSRLLEREGNVAVSDASLHHFKQFKSRFEPLKKLTEEIHIRINTQLPVKVNMMEIFPMNIASLQWNYRRI